jgi:large subunit ribosomal protein L9
MKVILQKDVKGKGKAGDIINVNNGYARNYLIPMNLAIPGDAGNINAAQVKKSADAHRLDVQRQNAKKLADSMSGLTVKVYAKAGSGKLFGSIGAQEIADALREQYDIDVDKKRIRLDEPIKALGITDVKAHLYEKTDTTFKVEVLPIQP